MLLFLVIVIAALVGFIATRPTDFRITRTATMRVPPSAVFAQVNNFHNWEAWSPWAKLDPNSKTTYSGTPSGVGAGFSWNGNNKVGEGRMTITESRPSEYILMDLVFLRPFKATNKTEFGFTPNGDQTAVTWSMSGKNNFIGKAVTLVMNCDKMIGGQFDQGLASIKAIVEK